MSEIGDLLERRSRLLTEQRRLESEMKKSGETLNVIAPLLLDPLSGVFLEQSYPQNWNGWQGRNHVTTRELPGDFLALTLMHKRYAELTMEIGEIEQQLERRNVAY